MATVEELKEMIVELKVDLAKASVPNGHCPYAYYPGIKQDGDCDDCNKCKREFFEKYENIVRARVEKL